MPLAFAIEDALPTTVPQHSEFGTVVGSLNGLRQAADWSRYRDCYKKRSFDFAGMFAAKVYDLASNSEDVFFGKWKCFSSTHDEGMRAGGRRLFGRGGA